MPRPRVRRAYDGEEFNATYSQTVFLTAAELITAGRHKDPKETLSSFMMLLQNLSDMAGDLGYPDESRALMQVSEMFEERI